MNTKTISSQKDLLADHFINHLRVEKGLAENTIQSYSQDLIRFFRYLDAGDISPLHVKQDDITDYMSTLRGALSVPENVLSLSCL